MSNFLEYIPRNSKFLYSAFESFTNQDIVNLLKEEGVKTKQERGNRIFPISDRSEDVLCALRQKMKKNGVEIKQSAKVNKILVEKNKTTGVKLENGTIMKADKVILATGGKSYPLTGSTGDGYILAKQLGHHIIEPKGSLVPLVASDFVICKQLQGLSLKNIGIKLIDQEKNKIIYEDFGEMIFTHFGVSGPTILSGSAHLLRYKEVNHLLSENKISVVIDLKPALDFQKMDARLRRDFEEYKNRQFKNSLDQLLPQKIIDVMIRLSKIDPNKKVNEITKEERLFLVNLFKKFEIKIKDFGNIEEAIVTAGGIDVKEINPRTMESKLVKGLFFAGEIIDVDAYTGGFNLQIAYSTGYTAGLT